MIALTKSELQAILNDENFTDDATVWISEEGVYHFVTPYIPSTSVKKEQTDDQH